MTSRDRLVVSALASAALLATMWFLAVAPKRKDASNAARSLNAAQSSLAAAQQQVAAARVAATSYAQNLQTVKADYNAVPATDAVAKLLPTLQQTSTRRKVDFRVISVAAATPPAPVAGASPATPSPATALGGFSQTSFTFTFNGGYRLFQNFLHGLDRFVIVGSDGKVHAHNRLLVINSVALKPRPPGHGQTQAAITASAYSQAAAAPSAPATGLPGPAPAAIAGHAHATPAAASQAP